MAEKTAAMTAMQAMMAQVSEQLNEKDGEISKLEQKVKDSKKSEETLHK